MTDAAFIVFGIICLAVALTNPRDPGSPHRAPRAELPPARVTDDGRAR